MALTWDVVVALSAAKSPTGGYAPGKIECPLGKLTRKADLLCSDEQKWISERNKMTNENLKKFLSQSGLAHFDADSFISSTKNGRSLEVGLAFSGGGYRAMLSGAGQLAALDNRTTGAHEHALGGLLQSASYITGLSGGSWLVGSLVLNNFAAVQDVVDGLAPIWNLEKSILNTSGFDVFKIYNYCKTLYREVESKWIAGFDISLTDIWSRALSRYLFESNNNYDASLSWSDITTLDAFLNHEMPFPIVVADGRTPNSIVNSGNSTVFEIGPYELGSWDPSLAHFTKTKYLGLNILNGESSGSCVAGFDQAGYILGTSSSLFNRFTQYFNASSIPTFLWDMIWSVLGEVDRDEGDYALYNPNPFKNVEGASVLSIVDSDTLYLVDGGEDMQNIPLNPLLQKERGLDVIFAYDNSADTDQNWPNGSSLVATYERQFLDQGKGTIFPYVPDANSFRNLNFTAHPTFFGCDAKNLSSLPAARENLSLIYDVPLIIYTANRPFTYWSNTSTFQLIYDPPQRHGMIQNGFEVALRINNTLDFDWRACVACAIIRREQERQGVEQSDQCKRCFKKYCWDGSLDISEPKVNFTSEGTTNGNENNGNRTHVAA
ncbi:lysophospholipase [Metschnikowia bicuspidata]|uniref:Lysophospholipase n=1 Tax=Metschnikowia bicuspidata TaxID=27322 RepID=A0A4P9ZB45_9ASCO|nr:lysophospholipase [Metschnikowia bicuspidata]